MWWQFQAVAIHCSTSRRNDIPVLKRTLCAATVAFAVATSAFAQQGEPWNLQEKAYVVDMQGKMKVMQPKDQGMAMMKKRAKPVPKGMVFFINNGQLYMMQATAACSRPISDHNTTHAEIAAHPASGPRFPKQPAWA